MIAPPDAAAISFALAANLCCVSCERAEYAAFQSPRWTALLKDVYASAGPSARDLSHAVSTVSAEIVRASRTDGMYFKTPRSPAEFLQPSNWRTLFFPDHLAA